MSKLKTLTIVAAIAAIAGGSYLKWGNAPKAEGNAPAAGAKDQKPARPVSVSLVSVQQKDFPVTISANGVVSSPNMVDIRPQVTSTITKVHIKEGQFVKAGDLLFSFDSRADEVNLAKAQAQLDKDVATLADNQRQLARSKELVARKFVAQSAVDTAQAQVDAQTAVVASDKAAVAAAKVALSYQRIVAPSSGRTGIVSVYPGSLVQPGSAALVTITQMDPITVTFPLPQRHLSAALQSLQRSDSYVYASLPDNGGKFKGKLKFVDNVVDASSGTVKVKAEFENKEMKLWPGAYVNVDFSVQTLKDALVVPREAVIVNPKGSAVYIAGAEGKAELKPVQVVTSLQNDAVITGIEAGARVVVDGKQNLRPGSLIKERSAESKDTKDKSGAKDSAKDGSTDVKDAKDAKPAPAASASASAASAS